jgi:hypothetical protein
MMHDRRAFGAAMMNHALRGEPVAVGDPYREDVEGLYRHGDQLMQRLKSGMIGAELRHHTEFHR